ncbi:MAG: substrate-binding domain-containing protein [Bacteroidetes bacterium]|nr:substrate-binding domain-containing protein [Bacteroidota bacterium]MBS1630427.1 substrate-binding domain-containing protein [Bacteroidota bacterium]
MRLAFQSFLFAIACLCFAACGNQSNAPTDTPNSGTIDISVDETYKPVIEEELHVFDSSNPNAHINVHYKSEADCFKDYLAGKARLILVTRDLSDAEKRYCESRQIVPQALAIARDAVAVIVNPKDKDTAFGLEQLRGILSGTFNKKYNVVFDNNGSSTLRYLQDSILKNEVLGKNVFAVQGNDSVVQYVANNPGSMGFVGLSYVSDNSDPNNTGAFISKVKVAAIFNDSTREYLQPYQAYIALRSYPLSRNLFYIKNETFMGLGTGFANFLSRDRGQLIFAHAHLFPLRLSIVIRPVEISHKLPGTN